MSVSDMKTTILVLLYKNNLDHLLMKEFLLNFEGYWRDCNKNGLPAYPGIYMVYRCQYDEQNNTVNLIDIIYIGQAENIHERIGTHKKYDLFKSKLLVGEELCYSCAKVVNDVDIVENALIFAQKPVLNDQGKNNYNYERANVRALGACACLKYNNFNIG